mmetsp:Transcript_15056/g.14629  ORF Transcript_15056/g.14629 Transcript_15056/m.14629 type:complete len:87 (+) Transcript_15056:331-591(+)
MLNATLCATERTMCCIVENNQTEEGVRVPPILQPFMGGMDFIPYNPKKVAEFLASKNKDQQQPAKKGGNKKPKEGPKPDEEEKGNQ